MSELAFVGFIKIINMMKMNNIALAALLTVASGAAVAGVPKVSMTVVQSDPTGTSWVEDLTGLVAVDAQNNFAMVQGGSAAGFFQNGQFASAIDPIAHPDYWQWTPANGAAAGYWNWHTAQTLDGTTPATTTGANPWMSSIQLQNVAGHGDPDLIYAVSANNSSSFSQTYSFSLGEAIVPVVSGANTTYADISGGLTSRSSGTATISPTNPNGIQQFQLSADGGVTFVNAGVDVGPSASTVGNSNYGLFKADNPNGPVGQTWNYMQLVSTFTLSAKSAASLTGFASITPVPEPLEGAMLLLGLGLLAPIARRRNRSTK